MQRAAAYYKVCRGSFSGTTSSFGVRPNNLTNFLYLFDDASKRLQDVIIENKDCLDIIRERDGPDSLIYCDPPYFDAESLYAVDFPKEKHEELHHILSQCAGYIVVSYNDCPFIRSLYGDFYILAFRRNNPLSQKAGATYGELIITNYDPRPYIQPQFSMFPAEIENGLTPEELQERLGDLYPQLDETQLADLLARAFFVADLWGRAHAKT